MAKTEMTVKADALIAPALPEVDPRSVTVSTEGFAWRELLVRVPAGMTQDDLRSPKVWRKVQNSRQSALVRLDHLLVLAHDESWFARAIVTFADNSEAQLMIEKVGTFKEVGKALYSDGTYRVAWNGSSFIVERMSDGVQVDNAGYTTEQAAIAALRNQYPRKAG